MRNFSRQPTTPGHRALDKNHGLSPEKQNSPGQVPDVSLQEALGTVKPDTVACGGTLHLGDILKHAEFQQAAGHSGPPGPGHERCPFP